LAHFSGLARQAKDNGMAIFAARTTLLLAGDIFLPRTGFVPSKLLL
jgi:hypothetical protein